MLSGSDTPLQRCERSLFWEHALEMLPVGAYTCDADGLITAYNQRAAQIWGRHPALRSPTERYCGAHRVFSLDGSAVGVDRCWMALTLQTGECYGGREGLVERPNGERLRVLSDAAPIRDEHGRVVGAINILVDVDAVHGCGSLLDGVESPLHSSLAALAHGLRNPLAPIRNAVRVLRHGSLPDEEREWALETIDAQLQEMSRLIDELVDGAAPSPPAIVPMDVANSDGAIEPGAALRILVVDDNRAVATSFERLLRLFGHEVCIAHDGFEALRIAPQLKPDVALVDLGLPRMDGFELARLLRQEKDRTGLRLVAVTGWGHESFRIRAREAGFDDHLVKPVDPDALLALIAGFRPAPPA
jgi:CheY-like chemotaxis protein